VITFKMIQLNKELTYILSNSMVHYGYYIHYTKFCNAKWSFPILNTVLSQLGQKS